MDLRGRNYERFNRAFKGFRAFRVMPDNWLWWFVFIFLLERCKNMFDYQTGYYEYNYRTLREAQEAKKQAGKGAKITTFLSTNENMEIITIYRLTFTALF